MLQIILLIVGIIYALRWPRLKKLTAARFPGVPEDKFREWRAMEMQSIQFFLWATWGVLLASIGTALLVGEAFPGGAIGIQIAFFVLFLILLVLSAIPGSKAAKLKKQLNIQWP